MAALCKRCNELLDVTRSLKKDQPDQEDIDTVSSSEHERNYEKIVEQLLKKKNISIDDIDLNEAEIKELQKSAHYKKRNAKEKKIIKSKLSSMIEKMEGNNDSGGQDYYFCSNCSYSEPIQSGDILVSRSSEATTGHDPIYKIKLRNQMFSQVLPHTREYNCRNNKCPTHKGVPRSAKFFRQAKTTHTWYLCEVCNELWQIS